MQLHFILLTLFLFERAGGSGVVSVFLSQYKNPGGLGENGNCCDGIKFICRGSCDHYFIVCLDQPSGSPTNTRQCTIGRYTTGVIDNKNEIRFSSTIGGTPNPKTLNFEKWEGGALLKVEVWDSDNNNNDFVELLSTTVTMQASRSQSVALEEQFRASKRTQLDFYMSVFCDESWYGPGCDVFCQPSSGDGGYYSCGPDGNKLCHPGWTGAECKENIDECQSGPCSSPGGHCVDEINRYTCVCQPGYTGVLCNSEINYCASNPCGDGATCLEVVGSFRCECPVSSTGSQCEISLGSCGDHYCHNNGTCIIDYPGDAYCRCLDGWKGLDCVDVINDCQSIVCPVNMTCVDLEGGYECVCDGEDCVGPVFNCTSDTCSNGGTCMQGEMGYACICPDGFVGLHCQEAVTCSQHPCLNNGTCVAINGTATCHCPLKYLGKRCENYDDSIPVDPCLSSPCYGQATCTSVSQGWECACPKDLTGLTCDAPTANITRKIMADESIPKGFLRFYGLLSETGIEDIRRRLNKMVGANAMVYAAVEYCTSHVIGKTIGHLIYKVVKDGKAAGSDIMEVFETKLKGAKFENFWEVLSGDKCEVSASESEKTVGAFLGQYWWAMLIVAVILVALCAVLFLVYRRHRSKKWQPEQADKVAFTRETNSSENTPEGVLSQIEALEILNSDNSYNNALYEGVDNNHENEYATVN